MARFIQWLNSRTGFRVLFGLFLVVLLVFSIVPLINLAAGRGAKDYKLWFVTGRTVWQGGPIYPAPPERFRFMYPPTAAELLAPVSLLGQAGLIAALVVLNGLAWWACIVWSIRLTNQNGERPNALLYLAPNLVVVVYVWSCYLLGQPTLVLLALLLAGFLALRAGRTWSAGAAFALAAAIKAFPVAAIAYLIYRRYWVATISMILSLVLLLLVLPAGFRGWSGACHDLARWSDGMLFKYDEQGIAQRPERSVAWKNQSLAGVLNRFLRRVDVDATHSPQKPVYVNFVDLPFKMVNAIIAGVSLLLGLSYLAAMPRPERRTGETDAIEWSLLLLLLLIAAPLSFNYLFAFLLFPFTVIIRVWLVRPASPLRWWAISAVVLLALTIPIQRWSQRYGNTLFAALLLFIGLVLELRRLRRGPASA
ncbi:MAG: glycosyltransferase 87 family protein [Chthoniobacterales bacterium]